MCISNIGPSGERSRSRPECASLLLFMLLLLLCTTPLETHPRERILSLMLHHQPCCFPNIAFFRFVCSVPFLPSFVPSFLSFFLSFFLSWLRVVDLFAFSPRRSSGLVTLRPGAPPPLRGRTACTRRSPQRRACTRQSYPPRTPTRLGSLT